MTLPKRSTLWLTIIAIGIFVRCYRFGAVPVSLNRDEAALGYNAYSIETQGIDEWGQRFPLTFKSFGDYKLPGYIYLDTLFIRAFGVQDWSVRLPSLLAGLSLIAVTFFLVKDWFDDKEAALIAAALVAIEPWAVFYARMAFEANVGK